MDLASLAPFLIVTMIASYIQTVTGFAFGLILVGAASALELVSIGFAAIVVSFTSLVNVVVALRGSRDGIQWSMARSLLWGLIPALVMGVVILDHLSSTTTESLRVLLGLTILSGGLLLMMKPHPYPQVSRPWSFIATGAMGGITGGLFSVSGPPIVFHLYRQPIILYHLKTTLLLVFGVSTCLRIILVGVQGQISSDILLTSGLAAPLVMAATIAGKRYPPPLSDQTIRRFCFLLLAGMGLSLIVL